MKTGILLIFSLLTLLTYHVEGSCTHQRIKREGSRLSTLQLIEDGRLRAYINRLPAPRTGRGRFSRRHVSRSQLKWMQRIIQYLIKNDPDLIPQWVILSFLDCFGDAGCDGCLDFNHPGYAPLRPVYQLALRIKRLIGQRKISNADFLALLGTEAAKAGAANAGSRLELPFSVGRRNCRRPPSGGIPAGSTTDTISVLKAEFDLSDKEAVALMGGHSLGRAHPQVSGYSGPWDSTETSLDSKYFISMNDPRWRPERVDNAVTQSTQWKQGEFLMLHADIILRKKFTTSGRFDEPSCGQRTITDCPDQPITAAFTREFQNQDKFMEYFSGAYLKMITKSRFRLRRLE